MKLTFSTTISTTATTTATTHIITIRTKTRMLYSKASIGILHSHPSKQQKQYNTGSQDILNNHLLIASNTCKPHKGKGQKPA
uniref:Uncharacterized protein n=1 Tax=Candidatus Kentrum sp. LPFa TaxID=2126335 RepID=A0A450XA87_9GAMM|nr:MAG: hypothetical protein BECKLPF1236A_GA0070988_100333 [Candidatus Kentron sp. LPFa]VFK26232.1 MAG: hypothetical protein BECKLPF1236C_GA0070990_100323 [Candidatus Kentron sp. LPFa]